jgi:hypothetical protein
MKPGAHWMGPRAGLDECGKSRPTGIRSPDRPARSDSLYRQLYHGPHRHPLAVTKAKFIKWLTKYFVTVNRAFDKAGLLQLVRGTTRNEASLMWTTPLPQQTSYAHGTYDVSADYILWRMRARRLPSRFTRVLPSSGLLRGIRGFESDVSGLHIGPIFQGQAWPLDMRLTGSPETSVSNTLFRVMTPKT